MEIYNIDFVPKLIVQEKKQEMNVVFVLLACTFSATQLIKPPYAVTLPNHLVM